MDVTGAELCSGGEVGVVEASACLSEQVEPVAVHRVALFRGRARDTS